VLALLSPLATPGQALPGPLGRHQVVGAVRRLLVAAAAGAELLLQVDDAHCAGDADVDVLLQLAMAGAPVCILLAVRPQAAGAALARSIARLQRAGALQVLDVEPLDDDECRRLVQRAAGSPLDAGVVTRVVVASEGNPFAAIELARCAARGRDEHLPASTTEAVLARLCDVPDEALALLKWLALCSDAFDLATIEALAGAAQASATAALDAALTEGVLLPAGSRYRFRHDLVRQALAAQVLPHRRTQMHRRIAELLAGQDAPPADIARHWRDGGKPRQAVPWLLAATRDALRLAAFGDALRHLEPLLDAEPGHAEALRLRAEALDAMGDPAALAAYRQAADAVGEPAAHDLLAKAALAQVKQGDPKGALELLAQLRPGSVEGRLAEALAYSGAAALGVADPTIGTAKAAVARRLALQSGDTASIVIASWAQAAAAHARGELHQSVWADLQETAHLPHLAVRVFDGHLCITQRFLYGARPYPEVIAFADALATEARRLGAAATAGRARAPRGPTRRGAHADRRGTRSGAPDRHRLSPARPHLRHAHRAARRRPGRRAARDAGRCCLGARAARDLPRLPHHVCRAGGDRRRARGRGGSRRSARGAVRVPRQRRHAAAGLVCGARRGARAHRSRQGSAAGRDRGAFRRGGAAVPGCRPGRRRGALREAGGTVRLGPDRQARAGARLLPVRLGARVPWGRLTGRFRGRRSRGAACARMPPWKPPATCSASPRPAAPASPVWSRRCSSSIRGWPSRSRTRRAHRVGRSSTAANTGSSTPPPSAP